MRILVVEDDVSGAEVMARGLSDAGHECIVSHDGAAGLESARKGGFDVMIIDRMMPCLDGVGLVETLRRDGDETPVLFLSALGEIEDRVTGLRAGADDYLVKPYAFAELIARVEALSVVARPALCSPSCGSGTLRWISSPGGSTGRAGRSTSSPGSSSSSNS